MNHKPLLAILGFVLIAAIWWGYQFFGTASIAITSDPPDAVVRVDGRFRGKTPITRLELGTGRHQIRIEHSYFKPHVESVPMRRGDHIRRHVALGLGEGTFEFLSNPRGAWVEVDGKRVPGTTPVSLVTTSGPHLVVMGGSERRLTEQSHELAHGETKEVNFDLNMDPHGSVTFNLAPADAAVAFLEQYMADIAYSANMRLPLGEYAIRVSRPGFVPQEFRYTVFYGENSHDVTLQRAQGKLTVVTTPADAEIEISYSDAGRGYRKTYSAAMLVPTGEVRVRARSMGRRTAAKLVRIATDGASVSFKLQPITVDVGATIIDDLHSGGSAPEFVVVPPGSYVMGDPGGPPSELPAHTVDLTQTFAVSRYEITIAQYLQFANHTQRPVSDKLDRSQRELPVTHVDHRDAIAYANWLSDETGNSYRLLSESEWEYVARAGQQTHYYFGNDIAQLCEFANVADKSVKKDFRHWTAVDCDDGMTRIGKVGSFAPNQFGLYDISGNVAEWILDCSLPEYRYAPTDGSAVTSRISCETHGYRGGSWASSAVEARASYRNAASQGNDTRGIRLARDL